MNVEHKELNSTNLWNQFEATVGAAQISSQKNHLMEYLLRTFQNQCIMENRNGKRVEGKTFLGEDTSGPNLSKQHRQAYEKW